MRRLALAGLALAATLPAAAATFSVTTAADTGAGSMRQAILDANANPGADTIHFAIPGSGVQTIALGSSLPTISEALIIDGYSQPGASANTNGPDEGSNAVIRIELDGQGGFHLIGVTIGAANVQVRGLAVQRCDVGVRVTTGGSGAVIAGNFIGTDATGTLAPGEQITGIQVQDSSGATGVVIGGLSPADRNVVAGNDNGISLDSGTGHVIQGNLVGLDAAGTRKIPLAGTWASHSGIVGVAGGVQVGGSSDAARNVISGVGYGIVCGANMTVQGNFIGTDVTGTRPIANLADINVSVAGVKIGGAAAGAGNVIAASTGDTSSFIMGGIWFFGAGGNGTVIQGNFIGTDRTGSIPLGNLHYGIYGNASDLVIGGINPGEGNVIAFNGGGAGVFFAGTGSLHNRIRGNRIHDNATIAVDLAGSSTGSGPTPNDPGDADAGANGLQNYPLIVSVDYGATTVVHATLDSKAGTTYDIDLYADPACASRPSNVAQGRDYVGSTTATTDGSGHAVIDFTLPAALADGQPVTATATDPEGDTSEYSQGFLVSSSPRYGPGQIPDTIHILGQSFAAGATVTIGGVAATDVVVDDSNTITAMTPQLPPGTLCTVTVADPSGPSGSLPNAWISEFLDMSGGFADDISRLVFNQITVGVGGGFYGTSQNIKRQSMAVFVLKAEHGSCYTPPPCTGVFPDVPCPSTFAPWIEAMAAEGITGGCGGGNFCPQSSVRRDQMAVFLLKGEHGSTYTPPPCVGVFTDVACPSPFADWIEQLKAENVTSGCGGTTYCPSADNTRGQMATFLVKTFHLP